MRALEAGADVLLMPPDPERAIKAVVAAVESGRLKRQRIDESVIRVLAAKARVGILRKRLVDLDEISDALDSPEEADRVQQIADRAVTLVRNEHDLIPLAPGNAACLVTTTGSRLSQFGQRMSLEFRKRSPGARVIAADPSLSEAELSAAVGDTAQCSTVVVAAFGTGNPMPGDLASFVQKLTEGSAPVIVIAIGSPYVLTNFPKASADLATFNTSLPSEISAIKALFGEIAITGHLPVTLPDLAAYGEGIQLASKAH